MANIKALPPIEYEGMPGFLLWARRDQPPLYSALMKNIPSVRDFEMKYRAYMLESGGTGLGDFADFLGSVGNTVANAADSIGSFITDNAGSIFAAGTAVYGLTQQTKLAQTQLQVAQARQPPVRTGIAYGPQGQPYIVPIQPTANYPVGASYPVAMPGQSSATSFLTSSMYGIPMWALLAVGGGLIFFMMRRR